MNKRAEILASLETLGVALRRRLEASGRQSQLIERFGGVTLHQLGAVRHLARHGPLTMHELAERIGITPSATTQLVDRLVQHGLVDRVPDPADRRVLRVTLSEAAAAAVHDFEKDRIRQLDIVLAPLDDAELETLLALAERIVGAAVPS